MGRLARPFVWLKKFTVILGQLPADEGPRETVSLSGGQKTLGCRSNSFEQKTEGVGPPRFMSAALVTSATFAKRKGLGSIRSFCATDSV